MMESHNMRPIRHGNVVRLGFAALAAVAVSSATLSAAETPARKLEYNRDIRPILFDACFACHGPDSASRKADLRLDQRDAAIEMSAIFPGDADQSEAIRRILSTDPDEVMPPPASKKTLTPEQKEVLQRWVNEGAEYQPHWSFIPPVRPAVPEVQTSGWVRNPIDAFVLKQLEDAGLTPAGEADRRTLARRVALDLTGLPPEPDVVEAFVNDVSPDAYEKLVDELLKTPAWGEHRGRYWLDYARYADSHGIHFDNFREMWSYRDWVIDAFNGNMPYDRFTIISLAGDLLPDATLDNRIGSGFNRCNITTNEGGIIDEEYRVLYTRDRTETTAQVWMGLTAGCAVCHNHKFDPLSQSEFYEMSAFFNNTTQAVRDGNIKDTPPIVVVPQETDRPRWMALQTEIPAAKERVEARRAVARPDYDGWLTTATPESVGGAIPTSDLYLHAPLNEGSGKPAAIAVAGAAREVPIAATASYQPGTLPGEALQPQGAACEIPDVGDFEKEQPFSVAAWVRLPANDGGGALCARMDSGSAYRGWDFWVQRRQVGMHIINRWPDDALKVVGQAQIPANEWTHVAVTYDGSSKAAGVRIYYNGQIQTNNVEADKLQSTIRTEVPFKIGQRHAGDPISGAALQDLRIYTRPLDPAEVESIAKISRLSAIVARPVDQRTEEDKTSIYSWWLGTYDEPFRTLSAEAAALEQEQNVLKSRGTIAHVMQENGSPAMASILFRGEYDQRREEVTPDTPEILPPFPADYPRNRLGFARWLLLPDQPLTARVTVNRFWQEVFGTGLVRTSGDFGIAGELPSHPELLDWLAIEFRDSGWDVKRLFRLIVTSSAYRQSAATTPEKVEADPQNRLLSRGPRFRMDAEMVRDYALAASGELVRKLGGPSVKPYQPEGVWEAVAMIGSNTRDYRRDTGESLYRRSLYTFWKRSAPPAQLDIFNAPARETCTVRRERTNTPLQALATLNDEQYVEAARHLAQRALLSAADEAARIDFIARRLLSRPLRPEEQPIVAGSLAELKSYYTGHAEDAGKLITVGESKPDPSLPPAELAAWTMLTNQLMNLDEVLCK